MRAALFGIDMNNEKNQKAKGEQSLFTFQDPKVYENMSKEEKKELTEKMMNSHKQWAEKAL